MTGYTVRSWDDKGVVCDMAAGPDRNVERLRCGCVVVALCIEGAIPERIWCAGCVMAKKLEAYE